MKNGYVTLLSVLVVSVVGVAVTLSLLVLGLDAARNSFVVEQTYQAKGLAHACAERALQEIQENTTYTGSDTLSIGQGSCSYIVTDTGGDTRNIEASGAVDSLIQRVEIDVDGLDPVITISSWQEVADF